MPNEKNIADRVAQVCRFVLLTAIAVVGALILTAPRTESGIGQPYMMRSALAEAGGGGGVCAAPGYLVLTLGAAAAIDKFYIVDSIKQVICVYTASGDKLRLIAARKFDFDAIPDASVPMRSADGRIIPVEGGNGVNRDEAKLYGDALKKILEPKTK